LGHVDYILLIDLPFRHFPSLFYPFPVSSLLDHFHFSFSTMGATESHNELHRPGKFEENYAKLHPHKPVQDTLILLTRETHRKCEDWRKALSVTLFGDETVSSEMLAARLSMQNDCLFHEIANLEDILDSLADRRQMLSNFLARHGDTIGSMNDYNVPETEKNLTERNVGRLYERLVAYETELDVLGGPMPQLGSQTALSPAGRILGPAHAQSTDTAPKGSSSLSSPHESSKIPHRERET
jgi:hypothetical protein